MLWFVVAGLAGYLAVAGLAWAGQRRMLFVPDTARPVAAVVGVSALREVELSTSDGLRLLAWYVPAAPGQPTLAYFHGNGGSLANRAARIRRFAGKAGAC